MQTKLQAGVPAVRTATAEDREIESFLANPVEETFRGVVDRMGPRLWRYFRARGCDGASAEELTQDVLFTVYRQAAALRDRTLFRGWLYKVAKNALLMRLRRDRRRVDAVALDGAGEAALGTGSATEFGELVAGLRAEDREILTLRFVDGLDYHEIAGVLEIPVGTAKWRVFNSKMKLAVQLRRSK